MIKRVIIIVIVLILIVIGFYVFGRTGPIASELSYRVLLNNKSIVNELGIGRYYRDCTYHGPSTFPMPMNPFFECTTMNMFNKNDTKNILVGIEKILVQKGWQPSKYNSVGILSYNLSYNNDDFNIVIEPHPWATSATGNDYPFLVMLSHTTLWKPIELGLKLR